MFNKPECDVFIPDGLPLEDAAARVTHLGIGAHQDDLEIMSWDGILRCFGDAEQWYMGVVVTNGAGSPRDGLYADYTDEKMLEVRRAEQRKAAYTGEYAACVQLAHSSADVKSKNAAVLDDLVKILKLSKPKYVYTHNLADKHDTHVAVALRVIEAIRLLPPDERPEALYGCEVWRGLDWVCDEEKLVWNVSAHGNIASSLVGVYDSQVAGGKRYDLAAMGRRRANATFLASHFVDKVEEAIYGVDMTALIHEDNADPAQFIGGYIKRFEYEVMERLSRMGIVPQ